jgi:hypothetical protein
MGILLTPLIAFSCLRAEEEEEVDMQSQQGPP